SGRPPQQTDDVKQQILAALADTQECNGKIFLIGGSAGGCHTLWVALDPTCGNIPEWNADVVAKIKGVVSLSGPTDLGSREYTPPSPLRTLRTLSTTTQMWRKTIPTASQSSMASRRFLSWQTPRTSRRSAY